MSTCVTKLKTAGMKAKEVMNAPFRMLCAALLSLMTMVTSIAPTFCAKINSTLDMDTLFGNMAEIIIKIAFYAGAIIAIGGIFALILAYKDDNADGQTRAVRLIVVGLLLVGFRAVLTLAGIIS